MIRIFGRHLKELYKDERYVPFVHKRWTRPLIGMLGKEEVFLCPHISIDRLRGICDTCGYRFECFTDKWGLPDK